VFITTKIKLITAQYINREQKKVLGFRKAKKPFLICIGIRELILMPLTKAMLIAIG